jgi:hypothetical protein
MEFYVIKLALNLLNGSNNEAHSVVVDIYKADRQEYKPTYHLLVFKNDKEDYSLPIDYDKTIASDDIICHKNKENTRMVYVATSKDTPNKALAKIQEHLLEEYGSAHPITQAIPNTLRNMRQPLSAIMIDDDTAEIIADTYFNLGNKFVWYTRNYNQCGCITKYSNI